MIVEECCTRILCLKARLLTRSSLEKYLSGLRTPLWDNQQHPESTARPHRRRLPAVHWFWRGLHWNLKILAITFVYTSSFITFWTDHVLHCSHCGWLQHNTGNVYGLNHLTSMLLFRFSCCTNSDCGLLLWHCAILLHWNMQHCFQCQKPVCSLILRSDRPPSLQPAHKPDGNCTLFT